MFLHKHIYMIKVNMSKLKMMACTSWIYWNNRFYKRVHNVGVMFDHQINIAEFVVLCGKKYCLRFTLWFKWFMARLERYLARFERYLHGLSNICKVLATFTCLEPHMQGLSNISFFERLLQGFRDFLMFQLHLHMVKFGDNLFNWNPVN